MSCGTHVNQGRLFVAKFTDSRGKEWQLAITVNTAKRLKTDGFNFHELAENRFAKYIAILQDPVEFTHLLWLLCKPDAEKAGLTEDYFGDFNGDELAAAQEAFASAYAAFFPNPQTRSALNLIRERMAKMDETAVQVMNDNADRVEARMKKKLATVFTDEQIDAILDKHLTLLTSSSDASPASAGNSA